MDLVQRIRMIVRGLFLAFLKDSILKVLDEIVESEDTQAYVDSLNPWLKVVAQEVLKALDKLPDLVIEEIKELEGNIP